ncbi:hypothetical protein TRFO_38072 [Tritrichomonas foetus]|uniref:Anaphase-promoting complex subunit 4 WD40 domain-containing protein n=1 Tax=Tritrichomonas foetus TaxID=1144522 RepID=A0A1J4JDP4_9EUKA|nr:hypothetical protein TRFO_38072 [Tritrichomonas foetus]|eukprot:OHS95795.1 hypothetical protein TRFO_38072 [Tritrichomonas foetus]
MDTTLQATISSINTDECGHKVAVSLQDDSVLLLDSQNLRPIATLRISGATPNSVDFSANTYGPLLAVGCSDGTVRLYNGNNEIKRFDPQKGSILSVAFHPTKCIVASASLNGTFSVHTKNGNDWTSTTIDACHMGLTSIAWGPNSSSDVLLTLIVGGADGVVRIYKSTGNSWELICASQVHNGWVRDLASPNAPHGGTFKVASCSDDSAAVLKVTNNEIEVSKISPIDFAVNGVAFAMVDKTLVLSHVNGQTTLWTESENGQWIMSNGNQ